MNKGSNVRTQPALLVMDVQQGVFSRPIKNDPLPATLEKINELIDLFHSLNLPVVHVLTIHQPDGGSGDLLMKQRGETILVAGTPEAAELTEVHTAESDAVVNKTRHSAFVRTSLENVLWDKGINTVILAGFSTHACVGLTAIDAYERDIMPVLAGEAMLGIQRQREAGMLQVLKDEYAIEPVSNERIRELLTGWRAN